MNADTGRTTLWHLITPWVSLGLVVYGFLASTSEQYVFPGALPTVLGTLGLLGSLHGRNQRQILVRILTLPPVLYVGRISYSLYLWHWPVFVLFRWTVGLDDLSQRAAAVALAFFLSALSYHWIETPIRRWPTVHKVRRVVVVAVGLLLSLIHI